MVAIRSKARDAASSIEGRIDAEILLVEDQRSLALSFAKALHDRWGCKVLIATTLEQVKQIIDQKKYDFFLTVSDLVLPDAPNGEVIDVLTAAGYPTIAMTGTLDEKMHDPLVKRGVIDYVLKRSVKSYDYLIKMVGRLYRNRRIKVLVVDDDQSICNVLKDMLTRQFLQVVTANNAREAQEQFKWHPDIRAMLVDYLLPDQNGIELVAAIRNHHSIDNVAIIGISSEADPLLASKFLKAGANDFIAKPFIYDGITCRVNNNLDMLENIATIRYIAYHDYLTGLLNRRAFFEGGSKAHDQAIKNAQPLTVAMMDIDHFKKINDSHGHDGGDAVLRHFAELLSRYFGQDITGRLGGEEFALIVGGEGKLVLDRCEAFRKQLEKTPAAFRDKIIPLTVSIGVTHTPELNLDATIKRADENLYRAKAAGRNRIVAS